ncbi:GLOBIN domain-containing protein, partial [Favolaschia claudopus]
ILKVFPHRPTHDPEDSICLEDLCRSPGLLTPDSVVSADSSSLTAPWFPFLNATVGRLMSWFHLGGNLRTHQKLDELVNKVIWSEEWDRENLRGFSAARENKRLDNAVDALPGQAPDGWKTGSVKLKLPAPKVAVPEAQAVEFEITGIMYRPLLDVVVEAFQSPAFQQYHITPFELRWDPQHDPDNPDVSMDEHDHPVDEFGLPPLPPGHQPLYGEIYTTPSMLKEHKSLPQTAPLHLETIIAAYMFWSDSTHLANFGDASLWPLYTFFGNQSKYTRAKPTSNACHHQAYLPSLPDTLIDFYRNTFGVPPSAEVLTHLKRELMHRVWDLLLSPEFIHAYVNGIAVKCYDQVERLIFPRFFTYGADYPEKVLLATIKNLGGCPCPRCFITKDQIADMGSKADMRRRKNLRTDDSLWRGIIERVRGWIFGRGYRVNAAAVDRLLSGQSWVPTRNAFSALAEHGFNLFSMFVPDLLHEVELGIVKAFFTHVVRILYTLGIEVVDELNSRFRQIPTFGRGTIRRFHRNVSDMKKMAARDFEDILQCLIPAVEGLLPEPHNGIVLTVCFTLATWHAYAKLRLHTSSSLGCFRNTTTELGVQMRRFNRTTCEAYETYELPSEYNRRIRRQAKKKSQSTSSASAPSQGSKKRKYFNLSTYKCHSIGHYPDAIPRVGTTDSVSTQNSELAHRRVKQLYSRTNKRDVEPQIANHERRNRILVAMNNRMNDAATAGNITAPDSVQNSAAGERIRPENEPLPRTPPPVKNFLPQLKAHLLARLLDLPYDGDETQFSDQDLLDVNIVQHRIYAPQVMRINYTTYDMGRDEDTINPRTKSDIMVFSHEDEDDISTAHPYWYARVLGIFHVEVRHVGERSKSLRIQRMECLWVRWFGRDLGYKAGWQARRLHRVGFVDFEDGGAFGFLDPSEVIRAAHIIPAFHYGRTTDLLPPSIARRPDQDDTDFRFYYINCFVDRDMFMRYCDHAVGHRTTYSSTSSPGIVENLDTSEEGVDSEDSEEDEADAPAGGVSVDESDLELDADEGEGEEEGLGSSDSEGENEEDEKDEESYDEDNGGDDEGYEGENDENITTSYGYDAL